MEEVNLRLAKNTGVLIQDFCENSKLRGMTRESIRRYRSSLLIFADFIDRRGISVEEVNVHVLKDFLQHIKYERNVKYKTVENYFSALSAFYSYLVFEGLVDSNVVLPFGKRYLRRYKDDFDNPERRLLSIEEMSRLVNSIMDPGDKAIAMLLAKTGIRRRKEAKKFCIS